MLTEWGYEVDELPDLVTVEAYESAACGGHAGDERVPAAIAAASAAIRAWCGWHVSPPLECTATVSADGRNLRLPAMFVTAVDEVREGGEAVPEQAYEWRREGLVRRRDGAPWSGAWGGVEVDFTAGVECGPSLAAAVAQVVDAALTAPPGVREEHAGNVGTTFSDGAGGFVLLDRDKALFRAFVMPEVA